MEKDLPTTKSILNLFQSLSHLFRSEFKSKSFKAKITFSQFHILNGIQRGTEHVGKLADHYGISQPAMSKMVDTLVRGNLVKRMTNPSDRRQFILHLTANGVATIESVEKKVLKKLAAQLSDYSPSDQQLIARGVDKILSVLARGEK